MEESIKATPKVAVVSFCESYLATVNRDGKFRLTIPLVIKSGCLVSYVLG